MGRYFAYYRTVLRHKLQFFKHGSKFGVGLADRIKHDLEMLFPSNARKMAQALYDEDGNLQPEADTDSGVFLEYKMNHPYYVDYWRAHGWRIIPDRWMRIFITDRYIDCGCDLDRVALVNRDLFFYQDSTTMPKYSTQASDILRQYTSRGSQLDS